MKIVRFLGLILIIGILGCRPKYPPVPGDVIQPQQFIDIALDLKLAEANQKVVRQAGIRIENLADSSYHLVYKLHSVSEEKVRRSYDFYSHEPLWMEQISAEVLNRLNQMEP